MLSWLYKHSHWVELALAILTMVVNWTAIGFWFGIGFWYARHLLS